jgi:hypothetical protein
MDSIDEIKKTDTWQLYEKSVNFLSLFNVYDDTDKNYRMYNGNQWEGLIVKDVEPVQLNFIQPIVNYKVGVVNNNLWGIVYSSENYEENEFKPIADELCKLLTLRAAKIWERTKMDRKVRAIAADSCINDEGILYSNFDSKSKLIDNEILNKTDVYFGNENSWDIQSQPWIIIRKRMPVTQVREMAEKLGCSKDDIKLIVGDNYDLNRSAGEQSKHELDDMCTVLTKLWKEDGKVFYEKSTQCVELQKKKNSGLSRYPVAHYIWSEKKGFSRGEGVVRNLIANQIEVNKTLMRRAVVTKNTAFPKKVYNADVITNPAAIDSVGGKIRVNGNVQDVRNAFMMIDPAQMSPDVSALQQDLIETTRLLENAGDITTGSVNPEQASGKAILAVQNASQQSLNPQVQGLKDFIEDVALIWLDIIVTYMQDGMVLQTEIDEDPQTGEKMYQNVKVPASALKALKASVKIEITPMSVYDEYAQELAVEGLLKQGWFAPNNLEQLDFYIDVLPAKSVMPKQIIKKRIQKEREKQERIAQIDAQTQLMYQQANQFLGMDPESQQEYIQENSEQPVMQAAENAV